MWVKILEFAGMLFIYREGVLEVSIIHFCLFKGWEKKHFKKYPPGPQGSVFMQNKKQFSKKYAILHISKVLEKFIYLGFVERPKFQIITFFY